MIFHDSSLKRRRIAIGTCLCVRTVRAGLVYFFDGGGVLALGGTVSIFDSMASLKVTLALLGLGQESWVNLLVDHRLMLYSGARDSTHPSAAGVRHVFQYVSEDSVTYRDTRIHRMHGATGVPRHHLILELYIVKHSVFRIFRVLLNSFRAEFSSNDYHIGIGSSLCTFPVLRAVVLIIGTDILLGDIFTVPLTVISASVPRSALQTLLKSDVRFKALKITFAINRTGSKLFIFGV
jgi:hypothetical protein